MYNIIDLNSKYLIELREIAQSMGIERVGIMKKPELIFSILNLQPIKITAPKPKILLSVVLLFLTIQLSAWGGKAHDIIAHIAEQNLAPNAKTEVARLLNGRSMVYYAMWMDNIRSDERFNFTATWHYANVDEGMTYATMPRAETGDVLTATDLSLQKITSETENDSIKKMYLKFLIHLIGEIHCPMHAGRGTDRGGNDYRVIWFGDTINLHSLWDTHLLERARSWSYTEWAANLTTGLTVADIARMQRGTPHEWFDETVSLAAYVYLHTPQNQNLRFNYIYKFSPVLEQQLTRGGYRLAYILNTIFN